LITGKANTIKKRTVTKHAKNARLFFRNQGNEAKPRYVLPIAANPNDTPLEKVEGATIVYVRKARIIRSGCPINIPCRAGKVRKRRTFKTLDARSAYVGHIFFAIRKHDRAPPNRFRHVSTIRAAAGDKNAKGR